jgi:Fungal specific transcription factor domain
MLTFTVATTQAGASIIKLLDQTPSSLMATTCVKTLHHFNTVAYTTMGGPLAQKVGLNAVPTIATKVPYLMHAVLGFSAMHLTHLYPASSHPTEHSRHAVASSYHWSQAINLYQRALSDSSHLTGPNMDQLLSTCLLLDTMSFYQTTETADPVGSSFIFSSDPVRASTWLGVQSGLKSLIGALHHHISSSIWYPVFTAADDEAGTFFDERPGRAGLPCPLADLCEIKDDDNVDSNPYHTPLRLLAPLLRLRGQRERCAKLRTATEQEEEWGAEFTKLITFPGRIRPEFLALLRAKDHRALLILGYWFGLASGLKQWWIRGRAKSEGIAVCIYLEREGDKKIKGLLPWVGRQCGYEVEAIDSQEDGDFMEEFIYGENAKTEGDAALCLPWVEECTSSLNMCSVSA